MKRSLIALSLLAALPFAAAAQDTGLNYNYVEAGYVASKLDGNDFNDDPNGWGLKGSVALHPNWHVFAGYTRQSYEIDFNTIGRNFDVSIKQATLGVGFNTPIGNTTDLIASLAYDRYDADGLADSLDGYNVEVGARSAFTDNFEGFAMAGYEDGDEFDGDFYARLGAQFMFNQNWGVSGNVKFADGDSQWFVGPRFSW